MLGELIFESKGKFINHRVLSIENGVPKLEISVKGIGIFKGSTEVTEIWTYWNIQRSKDVTYGEGQGILMTMDRSEAAMASGRGIGKLTSSGKIRWIGDKFYSTSSNSRLAFLNHLIGVNEDEVDASGSYVHRLFEWK
jgi:hypothetical protein